jgi:hypothetical protein
VIDTPVSVIGPGCARCCETHCVVTHVVAEAKLTCSMQKNESIARMVELGLLVTFQ